MWGLWSPRGHLKPKNLSPSPGSVPRALLGQEGVKQASVSRAPGHGCPGGPGACPPGRPTRSLPELRGHEDTRGTLLPDRQLGQRRGAGREGFVAGRRVLPAAPANSPQDVRDCDRKEGSCADGQRELGSGSFPGRASDETARWPPWGRQPVEPQHRDASRAVSTSMCAGPCGKLKQHLRFLRNVAPWLPCL